MTKVKLAVIMITFLIVAAAVTACQPAKTEVRGTAAPVATAKSPGSGITQQPESSTIVIYTGEFSISPSHAPIGSVVKATGKGFEPDTALELVWQGFIGTWKVADGSYNGRDFKEDLQTLSTLKTDGSGGFQATFTVPNGFGFSHDVIVKKQNIIENKSNFVVDMQVSISPSSGPAGTPITINAQGIGWRSLENSWTLTYDNKFTGWISSVSTNGVAQAVIPATGTPGKHIIQIIHGSATFPYLNMQQSPQPDRPSWTFEFTVTDGYVQPPAAQTQSLPEELRTEKGDPTGPSLWTDVASGIVGSPFNLKGSGFPVGKQIDLLWFRVKGSRVSGQGWEEVSTSLGTTAAGSDGTVDLPLKAPDDLGGVHRIEAQVGGVKVAETSFTITPSAFAISPSSGPVGTTITIHLKGVGWTETANIYNLVYDNAYLGYACGFNSQGDVTVYLPATGGPGWHYIDLYPGIYKGNEISGTNNFRIPQLTARDDHPGEHLPVFHFAFQVTE
jgi:hypothetical protein